MNIIKEWKILLLILMLIGSILMMSPNPWRSGVAIKYVDKDSPFYGEISPGENIKTINEVSIKTVEDFEKFENYTGMMRIFHNDKLTLKEVENGPKMTVESVKKINLNFGMDIAGGTRVLLRPEFPEGMNESDKDFLMKRLMSTLETRTNVYGLKEIKFQELRDVEGNEYVQVEVAGASKEEIDDLFGGRGNFDAYIERSILFNKTFEIGNDTYLIKKVDNETIKIDEKSLKMNESTVLNGISVNLWNITTDKAVLGIKVFEGDDIKHVYFDPQHSYVRNTGSFWNFAFQILISDEGAERFAKVTENIPMTIDPKTGEKYLESNIVLVLDGKRVSSLRISAGLAGQAYSTPQITGGGKTEDEAIMEQRRLQSILESGALPVNLKIVKTDVISPSLGSKFLTSAYMAGIFAVIGVSIIIFLRYKKLKIVFPVLLTSLSEVIIILGAASLIKWTIDMAAIAGIIAAVGTGVDHQIIITDEISLEKKKIYSLKEKVKRAFFIIFGSAATTIAAMVPLTFIGIGVMRGFAITTIIGILVGILITRPAYARIIEKMDI
ncbi:MAG: hypothetical protein J7L08_03350 [Candidatus Aenigmarchaeota archaeon]|nr:hypothetical protein [Candidatus Aenigmarchaeota archaeon]